MNLREYIGDIIKEVHIKHDVTTSQIQTEVNKSKMSVNNNEKPKDDYSIRINGLAKNIVESNFRLLSEDFKDENHYRGKLSRYINSKDYKLKDKSDVSIVYSNGFEDIIICLKQIPSSLYQYQKFCTNNTDITNEMSQVNEDVIYIPRGEENYSKKVFWWTENVSKFFDDKELKDKIINYSNYIIHKEGEYESDIPSDISRKILNINFDDINPENFRLDYDSIKKNIYNEIIFVDCFKSISKKSKSLDITKKALRSESKYPKEIIDYLQQNNFTKEGSGIYGEVYSSGNIVIKITHDIDKGYQEFYDFVKSHKSIHLPKLGKIRNLDGFFIIPMEKLSHTSSVDFDKIVIYLAEYASRSNQSRKTKLAPIPDTKYSDQVPELLSLIDQIESSRLGGVLDIHKRTYI